MSFLVYLAVLTAGGNYIFSVFNLKKSVQFESSLLKAGVHIGSLERILMSVAVLLKQYEIFTAVIALKAIARYHEFSEGKDEKIKTAKAEYFLIGSLFSILWTLVISTLYVYIDRISGLNFVAFLRSAVT